MESQTYEPTPKTADLALPSGQTSLYRRCLSFHNKANVVWNRRRLFTHGLSLIFVIAIAISLSIPSRYSATAIIMPPDASSTSLLGILLGGEADDGSKGAAGAFGGLLGLQTVGQLYVRAAQSQSAEDRIIHRFDLMKVYHDHYIEECRNDLERHVDISEDKKSGTISIEVTDKSPRRASEMANAYVEELDHLMIQVNSNAAHQEREATERRVADAKRDLDAAVKELATFASENATFEPDDQAKAAVEISANIEGQLIVAEAQLRSLEQLYTINNQRVQAAQAQVRELQKQLASANNGGVDGESRQRDLPSVRKVPLLGVPYLDLERRAKIREAVYKALTQEYELARVRENSQVSSVHVLDPAVVPTRKSFPPRALVAVGLIFVSVSLWIGWILAMDWWETTDHQNPWKLLLEPYVSRLSLRSQKPPLAD
jgi:tyrosine-protein kinase Etk/Wzc